MRMQSEENRRDKKFYDSAVWKKTREYVLRKEPWCRECRREGKMGLAEMVDHIKRIADGGAKTSLSNLQPLCHAHHNAKRAREAMEAKALNSGTISNGTAW